MFLATIKLSSSSRAVTEQALTVIQESKKRQEKRKKTDLIFFVRLIKPLLVIK